VFDRECCLLYKAAMDERIDPDASAIAMHTTCADPPEWKLHGRSKDDEKKLLDRFRDPADPLQFGIVTSKLVTGFDAPKDALPGLVVLVRLHLHFHLPANGAHGSIGAIRYQYRAAAERAVSSARGAYGSQVGLPVPALAAILRARRPRQPGGAAEIGAPGLR
jgi:hypothetical protein